MLEIWMWREQEYIFQRKKENGVWRDLRIAESQIEMIKKQLPTLKELPNEQIKKIINFSDLEARL